MSKDRELTDKECIQVAKKINGIVVNKQHAHLQDCSQFTLLMFELHQKRYNLLGVAMAKFVDHIEGPFSPSMIKELDRRIDFARELVWELNDPQHRVYLPDF